MHNCTRADDLPIRLIAVGDELLEGRQQDTNSRDVQGALGRRGLAASGVQVVPDRLEAIGAALRATDAPGLVLVYGGLGSTDDDLTREAVAAWAGVALTTDRALQSRLEERWRARGLSDVSGALRQAQKPAGMTALPNPVGSAPGLVGYLAGRTVVLLPGVPSELRALLPAVLDWLEAIGVLPRRRGSLLLRTAQIPELALQRKCEPVRQAYPELLWSWWQTPWGVDVRLALPPGCTETESASAAERPAATRERSAAAGDRLAVAGDELAAVLGPLVYTRETKDLNLIVQELMLERAATLSVAESCTAGLLAARLTDHDGSSGYFRGGVVAYADAVKQKQLGVPASLLEAAGAVSKPVAEAMASGCRDRLGTDFAVAITGISGPGGGTEEKPVGTTWIAVATPAAVFCDCFRFPGTRRRNRRLTVAIALDILRRILQGGDETTPWLPDDSWRRRP